MRFPYLSLIALLVVGCTPGGHDNGAGNEAIPAASTTTFTVQPNTVTGVVAGTQAGYGVRTMSDPNTFRLIWTGDGSVGGGYHEFWGTMWTTGHFTNQVLGCTNSFCPLESGDFVSTPRVTAGGERIDWDTFANDGLDGFEVTTDALPLYFDLIIDGARLPQLVFFPDATQGGSIEMVTTVPFGLTTPSP